MNVLVGVKYQAYKEPVMIVTHYSMLHGYYASINSNIPKTRVFRNLHILATFLVTALSLWQF